MPNNKWSGHRVFSLGAIMSQNRQLNNNRYIPGSGVGATSIATRRAKLIRATSCSSGQFCNKEFSRLGLN